MFPRNPLAFWQDFARRLCGADFAFEISSGLRNDLYMLNAWFVASVRKYDCYPFPTFRSGSHRARPVFSSRLRHSSAYGEKSGKIRFEVSAKSAHSDGRTKNQRGSSPCVKSLSLLHLQPFRLPVVSSPTQPRPAQASVRFLARPLARSARTKLQNPLLSAARLACLQATRAFAADLTQPTELTTAASRGTTSAGRLHFYARAFGPAQASKGREPCSRRS